MPSDNFKKTAVSKPRTKQPANALVMPPAVDPPPQKSVEVKVNVNVTLDIKLHLILFACLPIVTALIAAGVLR